MCRIKFQGESLGIFSVYDVVMGAINAYLRVAGSPEPARSVSVKVRFKKKLMLNYTSAIPCSTNVCNEK